MENGNYQMDLVEKLSFIRYGGTEEELRAAHILLDEIRAAGGEGEIMDFTVPAYDVAECSVKAGAPLERALECVPYGLSGDFDGELKLFYAERGVEEDYGDMEDLSGYVVLLNQLTYDAYKLVCKKHASAFMTVSGKWYGSEENEDLVSRPLRPPYLDLGKVPGVMLRARDALALVKNGVQTVHMTLRQTERENVSRDVLAVIPGTSKPQESIVITAHYDSVLVGTGSWDNATGAANVMALYRYFVKNPARRTLRFIWCGSEEQGLLGSKAYIAQHEELVKKEVKFCFNFDMCGTVLGSDVVYVTGGDDLKHLAEQYCREAGVSAEVVCKVHSSDSAPFADNGVPALGLTRRTSTAEIHTRHDLTDALGEAALHSMEVFSTGFVSRVANAVTMPVPTGMSDDMKKELEKYFLRDKMEQTKKEREAEAEASK